MERRLFLISGLGADKRAFVNMKFHSEWKKIDVAWLKPLRDETIEHYAGRVVARYGIDHKSVLIGLSFGGLIAVEVTKLVPVARTILISSAATARELPLPYRIAGYLKLVRLIPEHVVNHVPNGLLHYFFSIKKGEQSKLFDEIVAGSDPYFVKWALLQLTTWKNKYRPEQVVKIHGTKDRLLPVDKKSTDFILEGGTHFMTWENASTISRIINTLLSDL